MMLWLRNTIEQALRLARQQVRQPEHDVGDALDLGFLPTDVRPQGPDREVADVPFICMHVTGVRGGYGVGKDIHKVAQTKLDEQTILLPPEARELLASVDDPAKLLGLWIRYRSGKETTKGIEYHRLVSHVAQQYKIHPLKVRTPHAGEFGNDGVGFSVDQHQNEPCEGPRAAHAKDLLIETAAEMQAGGHEGPVMVTAHRCLAHPSWRAQDPGANVWRGVVMPAVAARPDLLRVDYEFCRGEGWPIPSTWDPHALFGAKGRRLGGSDA